ncbi:MAG: hypothetical protein LBG58_11475 [Planctomycetaceae bacterium]|jgi:hypothetical protein|nr:hypothetical protein [Planctomycetaceae bacterium]
MNYRFFCFVLLTIFFIPVVCGEVPVLIPTEPNIRWITDPTTKPITEPKMKWGDTTRKFNQQGQPIPWAKDPTVVRFNGRYLMYFTLLPNEKEKKKRLCYCYRYCRKYRSCSLANGCGITAVSSM